MLALVKKDFNDKYTGQLNKAGEVIEVSKERFDELVNAGNFVAKAKPQKPEKVEEEKVVEEKNGEQQD